MGVNQIYKNRALTSLKGKWSNAVFVTLIYIIIYISGWEILRGIWPFLYLPLGWGIEVYFLNLIRKGNIAYTILFDGYKDFIRIFITRILVIIFVCFGWFLMITQLSTIIALISLIMNRPNSPSVSSLLFPGISIPLMLSQTNFIIKDDKQIGYIDAMNKSVDMMEGHKMEYFLLMLSFVGWFILACLTCGLGFLFLLPYWNATTAHYYEDLKEKLLTNG